MDSKKIWDYYICNQFMFSLRGIGVYSTINIDGNIILFFKVSALNYCQTHGSI